MTQTDLNQSLLTDVVRLQYGSVRISKKLWLKWLHFVGAWSFNGDFTLTQSSSPELKSSKFTLSNRPFFRWCRGGRSKLWSRCPLFFWISECGPNDNIHPFIHPSSQLQDPLNPFQGYTHMHSYRGNLEMPINPWIIVLCCGRNPGFP